MNGTIKIDSGIPVYVSRNKGPRKHPETPFTAALRKLKSGQSFYIRRPSGKAARHAYMWRIYHNKRKVKFVVRPEGSGCRVWRVK